jgi:hypothetical protein
MLDRRRFSTNPILSHDEEAHFHGTLLRTKSDIASERLRRGAERRLHTDSGLPRLLSEKSEYRT